MADAANRSRGSGRRVRGACLLYTSVPQGAAVPEDLPQGTTVLQQPIENIYLVSTSAMVISSYPPVHSSTVNCLADVYKRQPLRRLRHGICVAKMLDNVGLRYPHRASGAKAPRTLRPLPLLRFAASATGGAHLYSIQYYLRFWLSICRTSHAVSALRIMRYCL